MRKLFFSSAILFSGLFCHTLAAKDWHVDGKTGSNDHDGSSTAPFQTVQKAASVVEPGDTVIIRPGLYLESVYLQRFGTKDQPIVFRADKVQKNRVIISAADPDIRLGKVKWELVDQALQLYAVPYTQLQPSRMLYSGTDLYPYSALELLKSFQATAGIPGPKHGFYLDTEAKRLYVRLRPDSKYGSTDPNQHTMAVAPPPNPPPKGPQDKDRKLPQNRWRQTNFDITAPFGTSLFVVLDGLTFETPGRSAVFAGGDDLLIRNCYFLGCWRGGVLGRFYNKQVDGYSKASNRITLEHCEWHNFPVYSDVMELLDDVRSGRATVPELARYHHWVHKSNSGGAVIAYETGIANRLGDKWTIRNCWIHDCFEGLAGGWTSNDLLLEGNLFERCVDNAIQTESHAANCHIRNNRFVDVFQSVSWQPLDGLPWPGPIYVYQNLFSYTAGNEQMWGDRSSAAFKIGAPFTQWENPQLQENLANVKKEHLSIPGAGILIFNNTIIAPYSSLVGELNGSKQYLDTVSFYNNIMLCSDVRRLRGRMGKGGTFYYKYYNNLAWWRIGLSEGLPELAQQSKDSPEEVLPGWQQNDFRPAQFLPASAVPEAPRQYKYIGALQAADGSIASVVGVLEEQP